MKLSFTVASPFISESCLLELKNAFRQVIMTKGFVASTLDDINDVLEVLSSSSGVS